VLQTAPSPVGRHPMMVHFAARTDVGRVRSTNEDNYLVDRKLKLYIVCDGLGGHVAGEVASATAVNVVRDAVVAQKDVVEAFTFDDGRVDRLAMERMLKEAVTVANQRVHERSEQSAATRGMGTTLSMLLLAGSTAFIAHVGDSRVYRLRRGELEQLTTDHTLATELGPGQLRHHLTRAIGTHETVEVDVVVAPILPGDRFLLASDGLHGLIDDDEIARVAGHEDVGEAAANLIDRANERGGRDNITVVLVDIEIAADEAEPSRRVWPLFDAVRGATFFAGMADDELATVLEVAQQLALMPDDVLVHEGRAVPGFYLVADGEAQVLRAGEHVAFLRAGDFFGEDALLGERTSYASVVGSGEVASSILLVDRSLFEELTQTHMGIALKIALAVARSLARKVQGALRESAHPRIIFKDPAALSRPVPRPQTSTRILADTEPQAKLPHVPESVPSPSTVLQRPRTADRRVYPLPTQPEMPVYRADLSPPPLPLTTPSPRPRNEES